MSLSNGTTSGLECTVTAPEAGANVEEVESVVLRRYNGRLESVE